MRGVSFMGRVTFIVCLQVWIMDMCRNVFRFCKLIWGTGLESKGLLTQSQGWEKGAEFGESVSSFLMGSSGWWVRRGDILCLWRGVDILISFCQNFNLILLPIHISY